MTLLSFSLVVPPPYRQVQGESRRRPSHRELDAALAASCALCAALRCMPDLVDETDRRSAAAAGFGSGGGGGGGSSHLMDAVPLGTLLIGCPEHCRLEGICSNHTCNHSLDDARMSTLFTVCFLLLA